MEVISFPISAPIVIDKHRSQELDAGCEASPQTPSALTDCEAGIRIWMQDKSLAKQADKWGALASEDAQLIQITI